MCIQHMLDTTSNLLYEVSVLLCLLLLRAYISLSIAEYHLFPKRLVVLQVCSMQQLQEPRHLVG